MYDQGELLGMHSGCLCCRSNNVRFWKEQSLLSFPVFFPNSDSLGLLTLKADGRRRVYGCGPGRCLGGVGSRVSRGCLGGVAVVTRWFLGGVSVVSRWSLGDVLVVSRSCLGGVSTMSRWWCLGGLSMGSWWCLSGVLGVSVVSGLCPWCLGGVLENLF